MASVLQARFIVALITDLSGYALAPLGDSIHYFRPVAVPVAFGRLDTSARLGGANLIVFLMVVSGSLQTWSSPVTCSVLIVSKTYSSNPEVVPSKFCHGEY